MSETTPAQPVTPLVCEHGSLARVCRICELELEVAALKHDIERHVVIAGREAAARVEAERISAKRAADRDELLMKLEDAERVAVERCAQWEKDAARYRHLREVLDAQGDERGGWCLQLFTDITCSDMPNLADIDAAIDRALALAAPPGDD